MADESTADRTQVQSAAPTVNAETARGFPAIPGYQIVRELGRGGMGVVYEARHLKLDRAVALKLMKNDDPLNKARFLAEGQVIAAVKHPNVVEVYDFGESDIGPYIAMEYLTGGSLKSGSPLPPRVAAETIAKIASGVGAAHDLGIVHRDLKPGNVLLDANGHPKVTDFGLAKRTASDLTQTQDAAGTPAYMAPEQARAMKFVGPPADVWSLGVMLYESLTGRRPFRAESDLQMLITIQSDNPPSLRNVTKGIPNDLETICMKCLEKIPSMRYSNAAELAEDLWAFLEHRSILARRVSALERIWMRVHRHPALATMIFIFAVVLLSLPLIFWFHAQRVEALSIANERQQELRRQESKARYLAESAATSQLYFAKYFASQQKLTEERSGWTWTSAADLAQAVKLDTESRDEVALRTALLACDVVGDARFGPELVSTVHTGANLATSPNGSWLAVGSRRSEGLNWLSVPVQIYSHADRKVRFTFAVPASPFDGRKGRISPDGVRTLAFSPDSRWLFIGTRSGKTHRWSVLEPLHNPVTWETGSTEITGIAFTPDSRFVYIMNRSGSVSRFVADGNGQATASFQPASEGNDTLGGIEHLSDHDVSALLVGSASETVALEASTLAASQNPLKEEANAKARSIQFHPLTRTLFVLHSDVILAIDPSSGYRVREFAGPAGSDQTSLFRINPQGTLLAGLTVGGDLLVWSFIDARLTAQIHLGTAFDLAFAPDGQALFISTEQGIRTVELSSSRTRRQSHVSSRRVFDFSASGPDLLAMTGAIVPHKVHKIEAWRIKSDSLQEKVPITERGLWTFFVAAGRSGAFLGSYFWKDKHRLFAFNPNGMSNELLDDGLSNLRAIALGKDNTRFWTAEDADVFARSFVTGNVVAKWKNPTDALSRRGGVTSLSLGEAELLVGCHDGRVSQIDPETLVERQFWVVEGERITALESSFPDSFLGTESGNVYRIGNRTGQLEHLGQPHADRVASVSYSDKHKWLLTAGREGGIHIHSVGPKGLRREFSLPHQKGAKPYRALFTDDGQQIAVLYDGQHGLHLWSVAAIRELFRKHDVTLEP